jgi:hypothetical protein
VYQALPYQSDVLIIIPSSVLPLFKTIPIEIIDGKYSTVLLCDYRSKLVSNKK